MDEPADAFIVGETLPEVSNYAHLDLGWERLSATIWADDEGNEVRYVTQSNRLLNADRGATVYLVGSYYDRDDWYEIEEIIETQKLKIKNL